MNQNLIHQYRTTQAWKFSETILYKRSQEFSLQLSNTERIQLNQQTHMSSRKPIQTGESKLISKKKEDIKCFMCLILHSALLTLTVQPILQMVVSALQWK